MHHKHALYLLTIALTFCFSACRSSKETATAPPPNWVSSRPTLAGYYHGIGIAPKTGAPNHYIANARNAALEDIAAQINTQIVATTTLYQSEDKFGARDFLQSRIEATTNEFIEGYEFVEQWENQTHLFKYYRLSIHTHLTKKNERKHNALNQAQALYNQAQTNQNNQNLIEAFNLYIRALEEIHPFINEEPPIILNNNTNTLLSAAIIENLHTMIHSVTLTQTNPTTILATDSNLKPLPNIPLILSHPAAYLEQNHITTNTNGQITIPTINNTDPNHKLSVRLDLNHLLRRATTNIHIRRMINHWQPEPILVP